MGVEGGAISTGGSIGAAAGVSGGAAIGVATGPSSGISARGIETGGVSIGTKLSGPVAESPFRGSLGELGILGPTTPDKGGSFRSVEGLNNMTTFFDIRPKIKEPILKADIVVERNASQKAELLTKVEPIWALPELKIVQKPPTIVNRAQSLLFLVAAHSFFPLPLEYAVKAPQVEQTMVAQTKTETEPEPRLVYSIPQPATATLEVPQTEEEIEEKIVTELVSKEKPKEKDEAEEGEETGRYLLDENAHDQRKIDLKLAIKRARELASKLGLDRIPSYLVAKFMPAENTTNRSQVVQPEGPDGTYEPIIIPTIASYGDFQSEEQAEAVGEEVLETNVPVRSGKEGRRVTIEAVRKVLSKRVQSAQVEFTTRVVKLKKLTNKPAYVEPTPIKEQSVVEDNQDLKEVFKIAA